MRNSEERGVAPIRLTRRHTLFAAAAIPALALAGCTNSTSVVTITQAVLADAQNVLAGLSLLKGLNGQMVIPAATLASIGTYITDAGTVLTQIAAAVGSTVTQVTAQSLINDLSSAASIIAPFFPGNPYMLAVQALLPVLAAALSVVLPASVKRNATQVMSANQARALLGTLPRPVK